MPCCKRGYGAHAAALRAQVREPCPGLPRQGQQRAADCLADWVAQQLENELRLEPPAPPERGTA